MNLLLIIALAGDFVMITTMDVITAEIHLSWAAWTALDAGMVSFTCDWGERHPPELWLGEEKLPLRSVKRVAPELFGLQGGYFGRDGKLKFVLPDTLAEAYASDEAFYLAGSFNGWADAIGNPDWKMKPARIAGTPCRVLTVAEEDLQDIDNGYFKFVSGSGQWIDVPEDARNTHVDKLGIKNFKFSIHRTGRHLFRFKMPLPLTQAEDRKLYVQLGDSVESIRLNPGVSLKSMEVAGRFGAIVEGNVTRFRLFAPRAKSVHLYLYDDISAQDAEPVELSLTPEFAWEVCLEGNYHGWFYHYSVAGQEDEEAGYFDPAFKVPDPYARAVCGPLGPGIVVEDDFFATRHEPFTPPCWHDLVIAEAHVRDLVAGAPIAMGNDERLGFRGLNKWIRDPSFYLKRLGVNAVELQPVHEFDTVDRTEYGWGYMPVNYFSPASQYCDDPTRLDQITEFRETVRQFHRHGMAVLLDVVYNHVGEPNFLQFLDREYYFLLTSDGHHENHSGCGNTLDTSTPMVRKLILDSLVHWIEAYDVDGFRFDLGELIGKETFEWLEPRLKRVKPGIILIAEPWSFRGHIGRQLRDTGIASWNDEYREYARKYMTHQEDSQFARFFMQGSTPEWTRFPAQTINYVASHDDRCWIDKITENGHHDGHRPTGNDRRRTHMMVAMLLMSVGTPMIACGMDMMKSKGGVNNTYLRGDLNALPYGRLAEYSGTVDYFRKWISFRLGRLGRFLRLDNFPGSGYYAASHNGMAFGMVYNACWSGGSEQLLFVVNPGFDYLRLKFEETGVNGFRQLADTERWGDPFLAEPVYETGEDWVLVPSLSCGLFVRSA